MRIDEPSRAWQESQHQRILKKDATAFAELCEQALPHLVEYLRGCFAGVDGDLLETATIDCLLGYHTHPEQFRTGGITLYAYLRMAARYDTLNALDRLRRHERRSVPLEALDASLENQSLEPGFGQRELDELVSGRTKSSLPEILKILEKELDEVEKRVLWLMLQGERDSQPYVAILGIEPMDLQGQRNEVNKAKDRIMKKLRRLGARLEKA